MHSDVVRVLNMPFLASHIMFNAMVDVRASSADIRTGVKKDMNSSWTRLVVQRSAKAEMLNTDEKRVTSKTSL